jgi:chromosome segregation ATPase
MIEVKLQEVDNVAQNNGKTLKTLEFNVQNADKALQDLKSDIHKELGAFKENVTVSTRDLVSEVENKFVNLEDIASETTKSNLARLEALETLCITIKDSVLKLEKENRDSLNELKSFNLDSIAAIRNDYDIKIKDIIESNSKQSSSIELATTFVNSSQEIFNTLTMGNAQQEERIKELEAQFQVLDKKLESLESADLFLQEAHRMLTDKTTHVESESRKMEDKLSSQLRDQQEEINTKLKVQVASLLKDVNDLTIEKDRLFETIDVIKENESEHGGKIKELEEGNIENVKSLQTYVDARLQMLNQEHYTDLGKLEQKMDNNAILIQAMEENIKSNSEKILGIYSDHEKLSNRQNEVNENIMLKFETVQTAHEKIEAIVERVTQDTEKLSFKCDNDLAGLIPQILKNKDNLTELQKINEKHGLQISSLESGMEKLTEDGATILDELNNAEEKFNELDSKIIDIQSKLDVLDVRSGETVQQIQDITVLSHNIEVHMKDQEQKFEHQKALDMEGIFVQIEQCKEKNKKFESDLEDLNKLLLNQLNLVQNHVDVEKEAMKSEIESMKLKFESYLTVVNNLEMEYNQLSKNTKDDNKTMLTDFETLKDKVKQLDESYHQQMEHFNKELGEKFLMVNDQLQNIKEDTEKNLKEILVAELLPVKEFGDLLRKEIETLKLEAEQNSKQVTILDHETKSTLVKIDDGLEDLNRQQATSLDEISEVKKRLEALESDSGTQLEKLISLEEATFVHAEKAKYVDSLNERLGKMDEIRQQSEAKSKMELELSVTDNAKAIQLLKQEIEEKIQKLTNDIQGGFSSIRTDMENRIDSSNEAVKHNISGDLESRIIAVYSKFEEHKSLIDKTFTTVTKITEKVAQNETQQSGLHESWSKQYDSKMEALRIDFDDKIRDLFTTASEHSNILTENNISITQLNEINASLSGQLSQIHQELANTKVNN